MKLLKKPLPKHVWRKIIAFVTIFIVVAVVFKFIFSQDMGLTALASFITALTSILVKLGILEPLAAKKAADKKQEQRNS